MTPRRRARGRIATSPALGWLLAAAFVAAAAQGYGWQGALFAVSAIVFWLLLQFNRTMRAMRNAASQPVGHVPSAVMLNARLHAGLSMLEVVTMTRSLGERLDAGAGGDESWRWHDDGGDAVTLVFARARLARWTLVRGAVAAAE